MQMKRSKLLSVLMVVLLMGALLAGCFNAQPAANDNEPKVLKILGNSWSVNELSQLFEVSRDNVTVELIDLEKLRAEKERELREQSGDDQMYPIIDMFELVRDAMTGPNPPDVVYIDDQSILPKLAEEGLLSPLDSFITKDKFDIEKIAPAVREGIKELGGGTLYALAPTYHSSALFYNKDIFDKRGISYPTDGITWDEMFNLARQLVHEENGEKKYGFSFGWGNLHGQISMYSQPLGISMYDEDYKTFTVNTPEMERMWSTIVDLNHEGIIAPQYDWEKNQEPGKYKPYDDHDFIAGRAAMQIGSFHELRNIQNIFMGANYWGPDAVLPQAFEWDVVTVPVHPEAPDIGGNTYIQNLMGINATAENPDLAWQYISFINGERVAKVLAKRDYALPARTDLAQAPDGLNINLDAFTALKPAPTPDAGLYQKFRGGSIWEIHDLGYRLSEEVSKGDKTVSEALAEYQTKGQDILDRLNQQLEDGTLGEDGGGIGIPHLPIEQEPVDTLPIEEEPADDSSTDDGDSDTETKNNG